jgi:hypothetical protein
MKSASELGEVIDAIAKEDFEAAKLELGDFMVTLILLAKLQNYLSLCLSPWDSEEAKTFSVDHYAFKLFDQFSYVYSSVHFKINADFVYNFETIKNRIFEMAYALDSTPKDCLSLAYTKISNRQTKMVNGVAVK